MDNYTFGMVYDKKIDVKDADYYSNLFGEGSDALTALIKYCILNDIRTFASCKGHPENLNIFERRDETGYIAFRIFNNKELAYFLASLPHRIDDIVSSIENFQGEKSVAIYVPARKDNMSEKYFIEILEQIKQYINSNYTDINTDVKTIVDYVMSGFDNTYFDITSRGYIKYQRLDLMRCVAVARCSKYIKRNLLNEFFCDLQSKPKNVQELVGYSKIKKY